MTSFEVNLDLVGHILGERLLMVLLRTLKKYEKLGIVHINKLMGSYDWSAQRTSIWVCLQNRRAISSALKSRCLKGSQGCTLGALQGAR